ncbi:hypothetical protein NHX12_004978 [Muraenolepis orangiensis]|uniref:Sulfatase N-terminal domain-containing protein n=1 Tax=Muraenolepis orangiensis TaxID=630683 RepID=A0A9Q0IEV0_9TELE|nr:hypothetical protein NHX12_004978 [Muraenolepis orangiensis]
MRCLAAGRARGGEAAPTEESTGGVETGGVNTGGVETGGVGRRSQHRRSRDRRSRPEESRPEESTPEESRPEESRPEESRPEKNRTRFLLRYQIHTGLQHSIIRPRQPSCLPAGLRTLPQRLQEAGYATHMLGKKACLPTRKGYGSCDGPGLCGYDLHDNEGVAWGQQGRYSTLLYTQRARKILEGHDPAAVHTPLQPPKSYIYPYRHMFNVARRKYAAMVSTVDEAVHNVTYALRKLGYYRNSVLVFSTDNGAQPFTGGSNWPLRGRKGTYWEGGVRGVAFVHSPLLKKRRRVSKALLHITDWFPTLLGLAGANVSKSEGLDGFDVWPTLSEGQASPRQEILHNIDPLHRPHEPPRPPPAPGKPKPSLDARGSKPIAAKRKLRSKLQKGSEARVDPLLRDRPDHHNLLTAFPTESQVRSGRPPWATSKANPESHPLGHQRDAPPGQPTPTASHNNTHHQHQHPGATATLQPALQLIWDTSVQMLSSLPGRWWNLERTTSSSSSSTNQEVWLFNISGDPYERWDQSVRRPEVVRALLERLAFHNRTAVPVFFPPDDPLADPALHGGAWVPWVGEEEGEEEEGRGMEEERERYRGVYKQRKMKTEKTTLTATTAKKKKKKKMSKLSLYLLKLNQSGLTSSLV